jgi:hypothetical protein
MLSLLVPAFAVGCGSGYTNENVPVKVITQKDLDELQKQYDPSKQGEKGFPRPKEPSQTGR